MAVKIGVSSVFVFFSSFSMSIKEKEMWQGG